MAAVLVLLVATHLELMVAQVAQVWRPQSRVLPCSMLAAAVVRVTRAAQEEMAAVALVLLLLEMEPLELQTQAAVVAALDGQATLTEEMVALV